MTSPKRNVLITGCSDGGMGAELAKEFHKVGLHVYATARDPAKMKSLTALGIETLTLDVQSESSIEDCVKKISSLDILINNAGATYTMPLVDISIPEAKKLFDLNVWANIALVQAFLPLLLKSTNAIIANNTSVGAGVTIPFQGVYNASKSAMARFSDTMRMELTSLGISVVELRTAGVKTNIANNVRATQPSLPEGSIYTPAKEQVEEALRLEWIEGKGIPAEQWAREVVVDLLKSPPPAVIWRGQSALLARIGSALPAAWMEGAFRKMTGLDKVESIMRKR